jgi:type IV secretion/conjugal transfer VirB4 family ATPase
MLFPESSRSPQALADLLMWAALVAPGIVLNKDGSLLAGWSFEGPDLDSATPEELAVQAEHVNRALLPLGGSWCLHCDALRLASSEYPVGGEFPDPITRAIDDERRSHYRRALFETRQHLFLTYFPPAETSSRLRLAFVTDPNTSRTAEHLALDAFESQVADVAGMLSAALRLQPLSDEALLTHLHTSVTGLTETVAVPAEPLDLDFLLSSQDFIGGLRPRIGDLQIGIISLVGLPLATTPGLLDALNRLPFCFRLNSRFLPFEPHAAQRVLDGYRRRWMQSRKGMSHFLKQALRPPNAAKPVDEAEDTESLRMLRDVDSARAEAISGEVRFGHYTATLVLHDQDRARLEEHLLEAATLIRNLGIPARREDVNAVDAFLGSLPGHARQNLRRPLISTRNLSHLLPVTTLHAGRATNPSRLSPPGGLPALLWTATEASTPYRFNLHATDDVGHTLVVGPTGSGKSAFLALLMASWFRYPNARVLAFDKNFSFLALTLAAQGAHYDIAAEGDQGISFCPLGRISDPAERSWATDWCELLFELNGVPMKPDLRAALAEALNLLSAQPASRPTLTDLYLKLQNLQLRSALSPYTLKDQSLAGALLDAESDELSAARLVTFEMARLMEHGPKIVVPTLLYLFRRIEARLDGAPTLIILDEGWTFLADRLFSDRIRTWLKELRKLNAAVVFGTQSLADFAASSLREVLTESTATKVFLPNPQATNESVAPLYRSLGLNPRQLAIISQARQKSDYYVSSEEGNRLFRLELGPLALAFCGAGSKENLRQIRTLAAQHENSWPLHWLQHRNLGAWAEALAPYYPGGLSS